MHNTQQLPRLKPMVAMLSSAYAVFGLVVTPCAQANTITNPSNTTLLSTVSLSSPAFANGDSYINNGNITPTFGAGIQSSTGLGLSLGTISNAGEITSTTPGFAGLWVENSSVDAVNNSGSIAGNTGVLIRSGGAVTRVTEFTNGGTIRSNANDVAFKVVGATIDTLTNTGTISGWGGNPGFR